MIVDAMIFAMGLMFGHNVTLIYESASTATNVFAATIAGDRGAPILNGQTKQKASRTVLEPPL